MTTQDNNTQKIIIAILSLLLIGLSIFTYYSIQDKEKKVEDLTENKQKLQEDLDTKIKELNTAISENSELDTQLIAAKEKLVNLRDSISRLKTIDKNSLSKLNIKIAALEKNNRKLLQDVDSLKLANQHLNVEIEGAKSEIESKNEVISSKNQENENLNQTNLKLTDKVTKGAALKVSDVKIIAMKERNSGKLKETDNASRTEAFRTSFIIRENSIAEAGIKKAHLVIQNAQGKVIAPKGTFYDPNGTQIEFTDTTDVEYNNDDIEVITISQFPSKSLVKGEYFVKIYVENKLLGTSKISLN